MAQSFFVRLEEYSLLPHMIMDDRVIRQAQRGDVVPSESLSGHSVEELCVAITELEVPDGTSFFPVELFAV